MHKRYVARLKTVAPDWTIGKKADARCRHEAWYSGKTGYDLAGRRGGESATGPTVDSTENKANTITRGGEQRED